jgi:hypothetical protein
VTFLDYNIAKCVFAFISAKRVFVFDVAGIHVSAVAGRRGCPAERRSSQIQFGYGILVDLGSSACPRRTAPILHIEAKWRSG